MAATIPGAGITTPLTLTEDGNTDTLTIKSTDADANAGPILNLHRDSSSPADADLIGSIRFSVDNDAGEQVNLFQTNCFALDVSDGTEDFQFEFDGLIAGTKRAFFTMNNDGFVFNDDSQNLDFRVESNDVSDMLFVDAGNNSVLINKSSPSLRYFNSTDFKPGFEIFGTGNTEQRVSAFTYGSEDAGGHLMCFGKSRSVTVDTYTVVQDDDQLGRINFQGADGTDFVNAAAIHADVDGTPGANDMPGRLEFHTTADGGNDPTERMRISSAGKLEFSMSTFGSSVSASVTGFEIHKNTNSPFIQHGVAGTGTATMYNFINGNGVVGKISVSGSATTYATSSDYRLKENVVTDWDATTRLKQLKPSRFNFKVDAGTTVDGFLAHEVSGIVPEAITGNKDETETKTKVVVHANGHVLAEGVEEANWTAGKVADEEGNTKYPSDSTWEASKVVPIYQAIDQSKLVPLLVKTVQELEARIKTLEDA